MSDENVEFVRRLYGSGDFDSNPSAWFDRAASDVEFVNPADAVEAGVRRGKEEVLGALTSVTEGFDSMRHDLIDCRSGGGRIVAWVRFRARARGSDSMFEQYEAHTWTFRGDEIVRFEWGRDHCAALEAAGLAE